MREQVANRHCEVVIRVHQPPRRRDDAVSVRIRIIAERESVFVLQADELGHRIGARAVHPDFAVVVDGHEREARIDGRIYHADVEPIVLGNARPIGDARSAQGIGTQAQFCPANRLDIDHVLQIGHVRRREILLVGSARTLGRVEAQALHPGVVFA